MKRTVIIILCFFITGLSFQVQARKYKGLSIGANAAYNSYKKLDFEGFAQANLRFGSTPFEPKIGLSYRSLTTDYKNFNDLDVEAYGLFLGTEVYPFKNFFFTGMQFEFDLNRFDKKAMTALENSNEYVTRSFPGFRFYAIAGFDIPVSQRISMRVSGVPGFNFYVISEEWDVSSGGTTININAKNGTGFSKFVYQFNAGLVIRLWKE